MELTNIEEKKHFFDSLNERQKRQFAAIESLNLGYGGQLIVSKCLGIEADTIRRGVLELKNKETLSNKELVRKAGGGRKKKQKPFPN